MSDQQNYQFVRPSECLSISPSATLHHPEAFFEANSFEMNEFY